jgi:hypothetical protein
MNFLENLKHQLASDRAQKGMRGQVIVSAKDLCELIDHFESLDSWRRVADSSAAKDVLSPRHIFRDALLAVYHDCNHDTNDVFLEIFGTLIPAMIERKNRERTMQGHS